jgi:hypothetical protein
MKKQFWTTALILGILGALPTARASAIAFSDEVLAATAPKFVVSIHDGPHARPAKQYCTGSLIGEDLILTAAHCFDDTTESLSVVVGGLEKRRIVEVRIPEKYARRSKDVAYLSGFDIAIARLDRPVRGIEPARLPQRGQLVPSGVAYTFGYGLNENGEDPRRLGARQVVIENGEWAQKLYPFIARRQISAWGERVYNNPDGTYHNADGAVCNGDSGGPLLVRDSVGFLLVGVVSYGEDCSRAAPSVYTKVSAHVRWINRNIASVSSGRA